MATVKENLIAAKALIDTPEKWGRGHYEADGCLCALGAARKAFFGTADFSRLDGWSGDRNPVAQAIKCHLSPVWHGCVDEFNDARSTTHADVMDLFDRAIAAQDVAP